MSNNPDYKPLLPSYFKDSDAAMMPAFLPNATAGTTFIEGPGGRFEYPEPVNSALSEGTCYWFCGLVHVLKNTWRGTGNNQLHLGWKRVHLTKEAADQQLAAYNSAMVITNADS